MMLKTVALLAFSAAAFAQPTVTAVVNSTNYLPQLCPGMFASVYGTNFGTNAANVNAHRAPHSFFMAFHLQG